MRIRGLKAAFVVGLAVLALLLAAPWWLDSGQYTAMASAIQALAVAPAVAIAAATLHGDSHDRRVDRVLAFHQELMSGEVSAARVRLVRHLRAHGDNNTVRRASRQELRRDPVLSSYADDPDNSPIDDANLIVRFFARVNAARVSGSLDDSLLVELIGRNATWLNMAIQPDKDELFREPLHQLATWADEFATAHRHRYRYLANWGARRTRDFDLSADD